MNASDTKRAGRGAALLATAAATLALSGCGNLNMSRITNPWGGPEEMAKLPPDTVNRLRRVRAMVNKEFM